MKVTLLLVEFTPLLVEFTPLLVELAGVCAGCQVEVGGDESHTPLG
jgi:hypothetical protein